MQNCYKSGKVPQELQAEQDGRLSNKHIKTLSFLQEIVNENKELKSRIDELEGQLSGCTEIHVFAAESQERIKKIQEQYLARADEINAMLSEKHRLELMKNVEDKLEAEKKWNEERAQLFAEIERLKTENGLLVGQLSAGKVHHGEVEILQLKVDALVQEGERLKEEKLKLEQTIKNQLSELQRLQNVEQGNRDLLAEVKEVNQKNKELRFRISKLERDVGESGYAEQEEILNVLKNKLTLLHKEKSVFIEKQKDYESNIEDLKAENERLRRALADSERMRQELGQQYEALKQEMASLKKHCTNDNNKQAFKDFVALKRELGIVKVENEDLKSRLRDGKPTSLPSLKADSSSGGKSRSDKSDRKVSRDVGQGHSERKSVKDMGQGERKVSRDLGQGVAVLTWKQ